MIFGIIKQSGILRHAVWNRYGKWISTGQKKTLLINKIKIGAFINICEHKTERKSAFDVCENQRRKMRKKNAENPKINSIKCENQQR